MSKDTSLLLVITRPLHNRGGNCRCLLKQTRRNQSDRATKTARTSHVDLNQGYLNPVHDGAEQTVHSVHYSQHPRLLGSDNKDHRRCKANKKSGIVMSKSVVRLHRTSSHDFERYWPQRPNGKSWQVGLLQLSVRSQSVQL